jgi:hypothetical protein
MRLAERLLADPDLEPGQIGQLIGELHTAMRISEHFLAELLYAQISLVIAANQNKMQMGKRLAVVAAENANGDGLVTDDGKYLVSAVCGSGCESESQSKQELIDPARKE